MAAALNNNNDSLQKEYNDTDDASEIIQPAPCNESNCVCGHFVPWQADEKKCVDCNHHKNSHGIQPGSKTACEKCECVLFIQGHDETTCRQCRHPETVHNLVSDGLTDHRGSQPPARIEAPSDNKRGPPEGTIWFYDRNDYYYFLTNFIEGYPITVALPDTNDQRRWPTSEHLFQAMKFKDSNPEISERIRRCRTARDAFNMARRNSEYVDPKWQERNIEVMLWVVKNKFFQHRSLAEDLLNTGDKELVEHTEKDKFWGDGGDGTGLNNLGIVLMKVRDMLKEKRDKKRQQQRSNSNYNPSSNNYNYSGPPPPVPPRPQNSLSITTTNDQPHIHKGI